MARFAAFVDYLTAVLISEDPTPEMKPGMPFLISGNIIIA